VYGGDAPPPCPCTQPGEFTLLRSLPAAVKRNAASRFTRKASGQACPSPFAYRSRSVATDLRIEQRELDARVKTLVSELLGYARAHHRKPVCGGAVELRSGVLCSFPLRRHRPVMTRLAGPCLGER